MRTLGIDAYKRVHIVVAIDEVGRQLGAGRRRRTTSPWCARLSSQTAARDANRWWRTAAI